MRPEPRTPTVLIVELSLMLLSGKELSAEAEEAARGLRIEVPVLQPVEEGLELDVRLAMGRAVVGAATEHRPDQDRYPGERGQRGNRDAEERSESAARPSAADDRGACRGDACTL